MKQYYYKLAAACMALCWAVLLNAQDTVITNAVGMELVLVQPGSFVMGKFQPPYPQPSSQTEPTDPNAPRGYNAAELALAKKEAMQDAQPGFTVTIRKPFYIGKF